MTKTAAALLALLTLGSAACTASATDPAPTVAIESASVTTTAPQEMMGTWQYTTVDGSASSWTFAANGTVTHSLVVLSGPDDCRHTTTTLYEGTMQVEGRTLAYTATRATETNADCTGKSTATTAGYAETLTYEITSPTELVLLEVSRCQETDRASKDAVCRTTFAKRPS